MKQQKNKCTFIQNKRIEIKFFFKIISLQIHCNKKMKMIKRILLFLILKKIIKIQT